MGQFLISNIRYLFTMHLRVCPQPTPVHHLPDSYYPQISGMLARAILICLPVCILRNEIEFGNLINDLCGTSPTFIILSLLLASSIYLHIYGSMTRHLVSAYYSGKRRSLEISVYPLWENDAIRIVVNSAVNYDFYR